MLNQVKKLIEKNNLLQNGDRVIAAISGGPDSAALAHILLKIKKELNLSIVLAHLNHGMRGKESDQDEKFVKKLAKKWGVLIEAKKLDQKPKNENEARIARYAFLEAIRKKHNANKIALAHHADDQAETVLLHFLRGTGIKGLSGMQMKNGKIIRPLLFCPKNEILAYLRENNLKYRADSSNHNKKYTRNKIRLELLPLLEKEYNPQIRKSLINLAQIASETQKYLEDNAKNFIEPIKDAIPLAAWKNLPKILKIEVLKQMVKMKKGNLESIYSAHLREITEMLESSHGNKKKNLPNGLQILKKNGKIFMT